MRQPPQEARCTERAVRLHGPRAARARIGAASLLGLLLVLAAWSCRGRQETGSGAESPRPHVLFVSLDTLRADVELASLDGLARDAVRFDRAYVPMPFTLTAHMSMFTGLTPDAHSVIVETSRLPATVIPLAELLEGAGYQAWGWHANDWLAPRFGFGRGFEHYEMLDPGPTYADRVTDAALEVAPWSAGGPLFVFLHYMDPHSDSEAQSGSALPYYSPPEDRADLDLAGRRFCTEAGECGTDFLLARDRSGESLPADELALLETLYRRGVRSLDRSLSRLFAGLEARGLLADMLVVVVSDHGEEFGEHGRLLHSQPYEESIRVPLLVKLPGGQRGGTVVSDPVGVVDLLPTVADLLALDVPHPVQGRSLLPLVAGEAPGVQVVLTQDKLQRDRYSLVDGSWKVIFELKSGRAQLFDLAHDPGEREDLAERDRDRTSRLVRRLLGEIRASRSISWRLHGESDPSAPAEAFGPEARKRLEALGYLQ